MKHFAAEGAEVLGPTAGIGALNSYDPFGVVAALEKAFYGVGDARQAREAQSACVMRIVVGRKFREVGAEQSLQRAGAPLPVGAWRDSLKLDGWRVGHTLD